MDKCKIENGEHILCDIANKSNENDPIIVNEGTRHEVEIYPACVLEINRINVTDNVGYGVFISSNCGINITPFHYCPWCGEKIR